VVPKAVTAETETDVVSEIDRELEREVACVFESDHTCY
jgi:hypothetical protein